jgi:hypothetical protein
MKKRPVGVYLESPHPRDKCNFIHTDAPDRVAPATAILEFQLNSGQYTQVLRVCDEHLALIHEVTAP